MPLAPRYDSLSLEDPDSLPLASWLRRNKHRENSAPVQRATDKVPPALTYESEDSDSLPLVSWLHRNKYRQSNAVVQRAMDERHRALTYGSEDSDNLPLSLWMCLQDIQETSVAVKKEPSEATSYNKVNGPNRNGRPSFHDWWDRDQETTPGLHRDWGHPHPHSSAWTWHETSREEMRVGEKCFGCRHCPKAFGQELLLRAHEKSHTGGRPHSVREAACCSWRELPLQI